MLDFSPPDNTFPALCLDMNLFETQTVLVNDSIDAFISCLLSYPTSFNARAAVSHCEQQIDDHALKPKRIDVREFGKKIRNDSFAQFRKGALNSLLRCGFLFI